jgi:tripartite-type tricarboxylate transporter receptor subunit TctC
MLKTFAASLGALLALQGAASAQQKAEPAPAYPERPVRVMVGAPPGSGSDVLIRLVAQQLGAQWQHNIVVDNRPGAGGSIAFDVASRANPDGYTLIIGNSQNLTSFAARTSPVDITTALQPIVRMSTLPFLLVVTPSLPAGSVRELVALARIKPLAFASSGNGTITHLGMEMFRSRAGIAMTHVPYRGSGQSMIDLMGGQVQLAMTNTLTSMPLVKSGKLRTLGVTSSQRLESAPQIPTLSESGLPGFELIAWYGLFGPLGTPQTVLAKINGDVSRLFQTPDMKARLAASGSEPAAKNSPAQFKKMLDRELGEWERLIKSQGIRIE